MLKLSAFILLISTHIYLAYNYTPQILPPKNDTKYNFPTSFYEIVTLGNTKLAASALWTYTILQSDINREVLPGSDYIWFYYRIKSITDLDPKFLYAYQFGGVYLSIILDDPKAADLIYTKGLKTFPNNYSLNYNAGFNAYFEMANFEKAIVHFEEVLKQRNVPLIHSITAKLKSKTGDIDTAYKIAREALSQQEKDTLPYNRLYDLSYTLKAQRDFKCLSEQPREKCDIYDFEGQPYVEVNGKWQSKRPLIEVKINVSKNIKDEL